MQNKSYHKHNWHISWFDIKNLGDDDYLKKYNQIYQENKKSYFRKIFYFLYNEYGIEFSHTFGNSHIIWQTPKTIYWCIFRDSMDPTKKGKWCFKLRKTINDHTCAC